MLYRDRAIEIEDQRSAEALLNELSNLTTIDPANIERIRRRISLHYIPTVDLAALRGGPGCLDSFSASISGASAGVKLPSGTAAGESKLDQASCRQGLNAGG